MMLLGRADNLMPCVRHEATGAIQPMELSRIFGQNQTLLAIPLRTGTIPDFCRCAPHLRSRPVPLLSQSRMGYLSGTAASMHPTVAAGETICDGGMTDRLPVRYQAGRSGRWSGLEQADAQVGRRENGLAIGLDPAIGNA